MSKKKRASEAKKNGYARKLLSASRADNERISSILQSIDDCVSMIDRDLNIFWANDNAKKAFGEDMIGKKSYEVYSEGQHPSGPDTCFIFKVFRENRPYQRTVRTLKDNGDHAHFHCAANVALRTEDGCPETVLVIARDVTGQKKAEGFLMTAQDSLKRYYGKILLMQEEEKKRISRDLHDETGQIVIALGASLNIIEKALNEGDIEKVYALISENRGLIQDIAAKMKSMSLNLRPPALDILGLSAVLREHFSKCTQTEPIKIVFNENLKDKKLNDNVEITLYRIVQEAISNILKHSMATSVKVDLIFDPKQLQLFIEDNGIGFDVEDYNKQYDAKKMGLRGIKERLDVLNGAFSIESADNKGTRLRISLPLEQEAYGN